VSRVQDIGSRVEASVDRVYGGGCRVAPKLERIGAVAEAVVADINEVLRFRVQG